MHSQLLICMECSGQGGSHSDHEKIHLPRVEATNEGVKTYKFGWCANPADYKFEF